VSNIDQTSGSASLDKTSLPSDINPNRQSIENDNLNTQRLNGQANLSDVRQLNSSRSNTGTGMLPLISLVSAGTAPVNAPTESPTKSMFGSIWSELKHAVSTTGRVCEQLLAGAADEVIHLSYDATLLA
jgi:hypothetical protein